MPVLRHRGVLRVARNLRAFFGVEAGLARGAPPTDRSREELLEALAGREREVEELRQQLAASGDSPDESRRIGPGNLLWVFGAARTGSTWLASMLSDPRGCALWNEPWVGRLFGKFYYGEHFGEDMSAERRKGRQYIMGSLEEPWLRSIRHFVLEGAAARFPKLGGRGSLVIKEPNGSMGAPLLVRALPESRMVLLVRDPRDTAASSLDASGEGGWRRERLLEKTGRDLASERTPDERVAESARGYKISMEKAKEAYEAHRCRKSLVRYEDLRADPSGTMRRLHEDLGLEVAWKQFARSVERHSWENLPEEEKGSGKQHRKAQPGGWREDLTPGQARTVEEITGDLLREFYPETS